MRPVVSPREGASSRWVGIVLLFISLWAFFIAWEADLRGLPVAYYNRGAAITPQQLYLVSSLTFLAGGVLVAISIYKKSGASATRGDTSEKRTGND